MEEALANDLVTERFFQSNQYVEAQGEVAVLAECLTLGGHGLDWSLDRAVQVLENVKGPRGLIRLSPREIAAQCRISEELARGLQLGIRLGELMLLQPRLVSTLSCSREVFERFAYLATLPRETFWVLGLGSRNQLLLEERVAEGGANLCIVEPRDVFRPLVQASAVRVIFLHNHPSGDPDPSHEDLHLTRQLVEAGTLLGIQVLDHVIIGRGDYRSLLDEGLMEVEP